MKASGRVCVVVLCSAALVSCAPGDSETDDHAKAVAYAIGSPPQVSAEAYARKAVEAAAHVENPSFSIIEIRDVPAEGTVAATSHLVFRIHHEPAGNAGFSPEKPVTACYDVVYDNRGLVSGPGRRDCPEAAAALSPAPIPVWEVPSSYDGPLQTVITALPATPTEPDVLAALTHGMPTPPVDPENHVPGRPPTLAVAVRGSDVGVSYRAGDRSTGGIDCLLGSRVEGTVLVWRPSWRQVQPGELPCAPVTALSRQGVTPPH